MWLLLSIWWCFIAYVVAGVASPLRLMLWGLYTGGKNLVRWQNSCDFDDGGSCATPFRVLLSIYVPVVETGTVSYTVLRSIVCPRVLCSVCRAGGLLRWIALYTARAPRFYRCYSSVGVVTASPTPSRPGSGESPTPPWSLLLCKP